MSLQKGEKAAILKYAKLLRRVAKATGCRLHGFDSPPPFSRGGMSVVVIGERFPPPHYGYNVPHAMILKIDEMLKALRKAGSP